MAFQPLDACRLPTLQRQWQCSSAYSGFVASLDQKGMVLHTSSQLFLTLCGMLFLLHAIGKRLCCVIDQRIQPGISPVRPLPQTLLQQGRQTSAYISQCICKIKTNLGHVYECMRISCRPEICAHHLESVLPTNESRVPGYTGLWHRVDTAL